MTLTIVCDYGERRSGIPALLTSLGIDVKMEHLAAGDYLLAPGLAVERKASDFLDSILAGRLADQLSRARAAHGKAVLLIEGDAWKFDRRLRAPIISAFYSWLCDEPDVTSIYSPDPAFTARLLRSLGQASDQRQSLPPRPMPTARDPEDFLRALPGVGVVGAEKLGRQFGSIRGVANATVEELQRTIGPIRGARIHKLLNQTISIAEEPERVARPASARFSRDRH